jgi:hypothetical protein
MEPTMKIIFFLITSLYSLASLASEQYFILDSTQVYDINNRDFPYYEKNMDLSSIYANYYRYGINEDTLQKNIENSYIKSNETTTSIFINGMELPIIKERLYHIGPLGIIDTHMNTDIFYAGDNNGIDLLFCSDFCDYVYLAHYKKTQSPSQAETQINIQSEQKSALRQNKETLENTITHINDLFTSPPPPSRENCNIAPNIYMNKIEDGDCRYIRYDNGIIYAEAGNNITLYFSNENMDLHYINQEHTNALHRFNSRIEDIYRENHKNRVIESRNLELADGKLILSMDLFNTDDQAYSFLSDIKQVGNYFYFFKVSKSSQSDFHEDIGLTLSISDTLNTNQYEWLSHFRTERDPAFESLFDPEDVKKSINNMFTKKGNYLLNRSSNDGTYVSSKRGTDLTFRFSPYCSFFPQDLENAVYRYYIKNASYHFKETYDDIVVLQIGRADRFFYRKQKGNSTLLCDLGDSAQTTANIADLYDKYLVKIPFPNANTDEYISNIFDHIFEQFMNSKGENLMIYKYLGGSLIFNRDTNKTENAQYEMMEIYNSYIVTGNNNKNNRTLFGLMTFDLEELIKPIYKNITRLERLYDYSDDPNLPQFHTFLVEFQDGTEKIYSAKHKRFFDSICPLQELEGTIIYTDNFPEQYCATQDPNQELLLESLGL